MPHSIADMDEVIGDTTEERSVEADTEDENRKVDENLHNDDERPEPKFETRSRCFANDAETGLLYEAIIRRRMYGSASHVQLRVNSIVNDIKDDDDVEELLMQAPEESWHYFVHYLGWHVKWDRWVCESSLFEPSEGTKALAARLQKELSAARLQLKKKGKSQVNGVKLMAELEKRMKHLENERRAEERREELAKQGITMEKHEEEEEKKKQQEKLRAKKKMIWDKTSIEREQNLRERDLEGRKTQRHSEKLVLPFTLKKVMVEEWEIISQCKMVPVLPSTVTIREALDKYLASKLEVIAIKPAADENSENATPSKEENEEYKKKESEWKNMCDGIAAFFNQALLSRLLYRHEEAQYALIDADPDLSLIPKSELYGCEHLLRLFVHLPALLAENLTDTESRPILSKLGDLIRFLQKHQSTLFTQAYRKPNEDEIRENLRRLRKLEQKKRKHMAADSAAAISKKQATDLEEEKKKHAVVGSTSTAAIAKKQATDKTE